MTYAIKCLASIDQDHSRYLLLVHCFENVTSNNQTQGFGRVVFAISTLVACEVALLSQKVIKLIQTIQSDLSNPTWYVGKR